jgi:hypothetical protein
MERWMNFEREASLAADKYHAVVQAYKHPPETRDDN